MSNGFKNGAGEIGSGNIYDEARPKLDYEAVSEST